jgi:hypothetical protein
MTKSSPSDLAPHNPAVAPPAKNDTVGGRFDRWLLQSLLVIVIGGVSLYSYLFHSASRDTVVPVEEIYGGPLPSFLQPGISFKTPEGRLAQLFYRAKGTKLSIVLVPRSEPDAPLSAVRDLVTLLRAASGKGEIPGVAPMIAKVLAAQIDVRRADEVQEEQVTIGSSPLPATSFKGKNDERYLIAIFNLPRHQLGLVALSIEKPVDPMVVSEVVSGMSAVRGGDLPTPHG